MKTPALPLILLLGLTGCQLPFSSTMPQHQGGGSMPTSLTEADLAGLTDSEKNGKSMFVTGYNLQGQAIQDLERSDRKEHVHGCAQCHGLGGEGKPQRAMGPTPPIRYSDLIDANRYTPPYTDELIGRFLDSETKSNGAHANTGVVYKTTAQEKQDLINYMKKL